MYDLTQNVANVIPFVLVDAGGLEVPGLGAAFTVLLSANGGVFGASSGAQAELSGGWYTYTATAGECATAGVLALQITAAGCAQQNLVAQVGSTVGVSSKTYTVTVDGLPAAGVYCRLCTDTAGLVNVAAGTSNSLGEVTFAHDLPSGTTVYIFPSKAGVTFDFDGAGRVYDIEVIP
jgi:hypothetical protein